MEYKYSTVCVSLTGVHVSLTDVRLCLCIGRGFVVPVLFEDFLITRTFPCGCDQLTSLFLQLFDDDLYLFGGDCCKSPSNVI